MKAKQTKEERGGRGPFEGPPPPKKHVLVFPEEQASKRPQDTGMPGRYLTGEKGPGGGGGRGRGGNDPGARAGRPGMPRVPPKRASGLSQAFQPLPMDRGPFDMYGAMDDSSGSLVPNSPQFGGGMASQQAQFGLPPAGGALGQMKPPPRRTPAKMAKPVSQSKPKPLKGVEKPKLKAKGLPSAKPVLPDIASQYDRMLTGHLNNLPSPVSSVVRIFFSSTFSDYKTERNYVIQNAFPQLRQYCRERGFNFQVVDLRWGINNSSVNDHTVEALCLEEVAKCQRLSPGPNFVSMLGNRYGFRPLPAYIPSQEFDTLYRIASEAQLPNYKELEKWYKRDDNHLPSAYVLQEIRTHIPHYGDENDDKRKAAISEWQTTMKQVQGVLRKAAFAAHGQGGMTEDRLHQYFYSVTEQEIEKGILEAPFCEASCLLFDRRFEDVDLNDPQVGRFKDVIKSEQEVAFDVEAETLMTSLKTSRIPRKLPSENIHSYVIPWRPAGVLKEGDEAHEQYLQAFCQNFVTSLQGMIDDQVQREENLRQKSISHVVSFTKEPTAPLMAPKGTMKKTGKACTPPTAGAPPFGNSCQQTEAGFLRGMMAMKGIVEDHLKIEKGGSPVLADAELKPRLYSDILHHLAFCRDKSSSFRGREEELFHIRRFVEALDRPSPPLVLTSQAGGGKTAFIARLVQLAHEWLGDQAVVVVRFLGTTPSCSALQPLLASLCAHISLAYGERLYHNSLAHIEAAQRHFRELLNLISLSYGARRPLLILLDSIELLSLANSPHLLHWLPKHVPPHVKIIISMTPGVNNCLEHACAHLQSEDTFVTLHLRPLPAIQAAQVIETYLTLRGRTLAKAQEELLSQRATTEPPPLLLKLWLDEACLWRSYTKTREAEATLAPTISAAVDAVLDRAELKYGQQFVSAALGYLTICYDGISEIELEDVLSCNDSVLNEVYKYHNPPLEGIVRIPPLLWARLQYDMREYLVVNETPTRVILSWYYRQFAAVASKRYAEVGDQGRSLHADLATIFLVEDKLCRTITLEHRNLTVDAADRLVTPQVPDPKNLRQLLCVTHHLRKSGDIGRLKEEVVCNLRFLTRLFQGILMKRHRTHEKAVVWQLMDGLDEEADHVVRALRLTSPLIVRDIDLLPVQLLEKLRPFARHHEYIDALCKQAEEVAAVARGPSTGLHPIIGQVGDETSPVNWYFEGPTRIVSQSNDGSLLLLGYSGRDHRVPLCQVFDVASCQATHTIQRTTKALANDILYSGSISRNNRRAYLLCKNNFVIYHLGSDGGGGRSQTCTNNANNAGALNECMTVSGNDQRLVLAGPSRLAMFEDTGKSFDSPEFKVRRAMNLAGSTASTNLVLTEDETGTISTHTIPGQKRVIGALIRWTFDSSDPCLKLPLPEPVPPGCLQRLPNMSVPDCVLVACADGKIYVVRMGGPGDVETTTATTNGRVDGNDNKGADGNGGANGGGGGGDARSSSAHASTCAILQEIKNTVGLRGLNLMLTLHPNCSIAALGSKESSSIALFDLGEERMVSHVDAKQNLQALRLGPEEGSLTVLRRDGVLKVYRLDGEREPQELASVTAHEADATSMSCPERGYLLSCSYDRTLKQFELKKLLSKTSRCPALTDDEVHRRIEYTSVDDVSVVDDDTIVTGHRDTSPSVWNVNTGELIKKLEPEDFPSGIVGVVAKGTRVICLNKPAKLVRLWDWPSGKSVKLPPGVKDVLSMTVSHDQLTVGFVCEHSPGTMVLVYDAEANKELRRFLLPEKITQVDRAYLTQNSRYLVILLQRKEKTSDDEVVTVGGALTVDLQAEKDGDQEPSWVDKDIAGVQSLGQDLMLLGGFQEVTVWEPPKTVSLYNMTKYNGWLNHRASTIEKKVKNTADGKVVLIAVSKDMKYIVTTADDGVIWLWYNALKQEFVNKATGSKLKKHQDKVTCLTFSPNCCHLASGSADKTLILWDVSCASALTQLHAHARLIDIYFTPDGGSVVCRLKGMGPACVAVWRIVNGDNKIH